MDKYKKYRKIKSIYQFISFIIATIIGDGISSYLGIFGKKFFSLDTALNVGMILAICLVLDIFAIRAADHWYTKHKDKELS